MFRVGDAEDMKNECEKELVITGHVRPDRIDEACEHYKSINVIQSFE